MEYKGKYTANTFGMFLGGGYGLDVGKSFLFTPEASLLLTYYDRGSYTETSMSADDYPDKYWDSYDQWSYLSSLGATFSAFRQIDSLSLKMGFQPELRVHWLHEFNADMDNDSYVMASKSGTGTPIDVLLQAREEDLVKVGGGVRFSKWDSDTLSFGLDLDALFGSDYEAYVLSGRLMHRF
jgi:outer membrane autotransporter protein